MESGQSGHRILFQNDPEYRCLGFADMPLEL
jgi:hypothetical protein